MRFDSPHPVRRRSSCCSHPARCGRPMGSLHRHSGTSALLTGDPHGDLGLLWLLADMPSADRSDAASSTFVYLSRGQRLPERGGSCLRFSASSPEAGSLHIVLDGDLHGRYLVEVTAHELQHVVEVLRAPHVVDVDSFRLLFARIQFFSADRRSGLGNRGGTAHRLRRQQRGQAISASSHAGVQVSAYQ